MIYLTKKTLIEILYLSDLCKPFRVTPYLIYGRVGDSLLNDGSRVPNMQGGENGYLSVI